ncbi:MAG TPA: FHA domain-containing protein [Thermoanaerobaculaceae bacterium]|nr:FHA domain-containing protein [Thermoanaerobaculaceae bacterium]HRS15996.1 FHA domain-containing protein [Thermoanaerobaculaceae bacterium]
MLELVLLDGTERRFPIEEGAELMVGVAANCNVRLTAVDVSRAHALITCQHGKIVVLDLGSTNGTFVNGRRTKEAELHAGDFIRFSSVMAQLAPPGDPTRSSREAPSIADRSPQPVSQSGERRHATSDRMPMLLQESMTWLLGRWANAEEAAMPALVEWLVEHRGHRGAAVLEAVDGEVMLAATHGDVMPLLEDAGLRRLVLDPLGRAEPFEAVEIQSGSGKGLAVKAPRLPWLIIVPASGMPESTELGLCVRLLAVAARLDGLPASRPRGKRGRKP